ncbi:hypothetical protein O0I10_005228 [Lichtheimia ornata]|uniref:TLC domain-containing protein n=1 Tax=Lichtheimia ornata TaxID=688661 RepID=A0AAD7V5A8_9FUNG|nr:uncharacterized protein O0I10_005228 [Lichtheimia ornata]KAJ8659189.1 hypothetical protein O0I10_005228 [Lichtheimia ornata]
MISFASICEWLDLTTLQYHWQVVVISALLCSILFEVSQSLSPLLFPKAFQHFKGYTPTNWHIHVVSTLHAVIITIGSLVILSDGNLSQNRVFGYSPFAANIYSISCGYFVWDVITAILYIKNQGVSMVCHGVAAFLVLFLSYRPFINYYGAVFLLYEASTPFLNFNWFMDKLGWTGSKAQLVNGIFLISIFFLARIVFGFYMSYWLWVDICAVKDLVPLRYWIVYFAANAMTSFLNVYWFGLMIRSLRKRFDSDASTTTNNNINNRNLDSAAAANKV